MNKKQLNPIETTIINLLGRASYNEDNKARIDLFIEGNRSRFSINKIVENVFQNRIWSIFFRNVCSLENNYLEKHIQDHLKQILDDIVRSQKSGLVSRALSLYQLDQKAILENNILEAIQEKFKAYRRSYDEEFLKIVNVLSEFQDRILVLKGKIIGDVYPKGFYRDTGDVDIFLNQSGDLWPLLNKLRDIGYVFEEIEIKKLDTNHSIEMHGFRESLPNIYIDIHLGVTPIVSNTIWCIDLWNDVRRYKGENSTFYTASIENQFVYIFSHLLHHGFFRLRDLNDCYAYLSTYRNLFDWDKITEKLFLTDLSPIANEVFHLIKDIYKESFVPNEIEEIIARQIRFGEKVTISLMANCAHENSLVFDFPYKIIFIIRFWAKRRNYLNLLNGILYEFIRVVQIATFGTESKRFYRFLAPFRRYQALNGKLKSYRYSFFLRDACQTNMLNSHCPAGSCNELPKLELDKMFTTLEIFENLHLTSNYHFAYMVSPDGNYFWVDYYGDLLFKEKHESLVASQ